MLVEVRAVEVAQAVNVGREVRRHPVQNDADAALVQRLHQEHEILRRAEPAGRRKVAHRLVAPRAVERVLRHRHEFHVRESHVVRIFGQLGRHFTVRQPPVALLRNARPRAQVQLVDRNGRVQRVAPRPALHPFLVLPLVRQLPHLRRCVRPDLRGKSVGVRLVRLVGVVTRRDVIFVQRPAADAGDEPLPHARRTRLHRVASGIPSVEVADHRHLLGIRRPDGKLDAGGALRLSQVRAHLFVGSMVFALGEQVQVVVGQ